MMKMKCLQNIKIEIKILIKKIPPKWRVITFGGLSVASRKINIVKILQNYKQKVKKIPTLKILKIYPKIYSKFNRTTESRFLV